MWNKTKLTQRIGIKYPIIQAPMSGGATTPELVASVSNCGGLGSLGAGYLAASEIRQLIKKTRQLTDKPFAVNLFVPTPHQATLEQIKTACDAISLCAKELNINVEPPQAPYAPSFEEQIDALIKEKISFFSFTFGIPEPDIIKRLKTNDIYVAGTATTLAEAYALQESGVDAIIAQGSEAGGHRGSFLDSAENSLVPLNSLLMQMVEKIKLPIIASGGIMDGQSISNCIDSGASAVQLGTAFLCSKESGIPAAYKKLLLSQTTDTTTLTRAFSGKLARGLKNKFIQCMETKSHTIVDYPIQNKLTNPMRNQAKIQENTDFMSLWAGQFAFLAREKDAQTLFDDLLQEVNTIYHN